MSHSSLMVAGARRRIRIACLTLCLLLHGVILHESAQAQAIKRFPSAGVQMQTDEASSGYTLIHPIYKGETFLIDIEGQPVQVWRSEYAAASSAYLLDDGSLLRATMLVPPSEEVRGRGAAGRLERIGWDGEIIWEHVINGDDGLSHHDFEPLPNGNILVTVWDHHTRAEAIAAGRNPETVDEAGMLSESIREIEPQGSNGGRVVWEWNAWDHLIQNFDSEMANFGNPAEHPGRIDINITGYNGGPDGDWLHLNSVAYHPGLDQIMLSSPVSHELWIIDHSTSTTEAARTNGGRTGQGGELLYRWGNPSMWLGPEAPPQRFFFQHDPHWIAAGLPGEGNILVFNNGVKDGPRNFSTVDELTPSLKSDGTYARAEAGTYPPRALHWRFGGPHARFFANRISGAQRLPNGNTLICIGSLSRIIEVTHEGTLCWEYFNSSGADQPMNEKPPFRSSIPFDEGGPLGGGGPMFRAHRYSPDHPGLARINGR